MEEFKLSKVRFDFAVPKLRLLVEIDSRRWHSHPSRKNRDRYKSRLAEDEGWKLVRVTGDSSLVHDVVFSSVLSRENELYVEP